MAEPRQRKGKELLVRPEPPKEDASDEAKTMYAIALKHYSNVMYHREYYQRHKQTKPIVAEQTATISQLQANIIQLQSVIDTQKELIDKILAKH